MTVWNTLIIQQFCFDHACPIAKQQKWQIGTVGINTGIAKIKIKSVEITNKMQPYNRIYYSNIH
jgi:hypothetical protein